MKKEIKQLEQKLQQLLEQGQPDQLISVSSVKGIGKRAAQCSLCLHKDLNTPKTTVSSLILPAWHQHNIAAEPAYRARNFG